MSKGRNLTKRKWGDFRKSTNPKSKIRYKPKYPRCKKFMRNFEGIRLSMRKLITSYWDWVYY